MKNVTRASTKKQLKWKKNVRRGRQDLQNYPVQAGKSEEAYASNGGRKAESFLKERVAENFLTLEDMWASKLMKLTGHQTNFTSGDLGLPRWHSR